MQSSRPLARALAHKSWTFRGDASTAMTRRPLAAAASVNVPKWAPRSRIVPARGASSNASSKCAGKYFPHTRMSSATTSWVPGSAMSSDIPGGSTSRAQFRVRVIRPPARGAGSQARSGPNQHHAPTRVCASRLDESPDVIVDALDGAALADLPISQQLADMMIVVRSGPAPDRPLAEREREHEQAVGPQPLAEQINYLPVEVIDWLVAIKAEAGDGRQSEDRVEGMGGAAPPFDGLLHHSQSRVAWWQVGGGERGHAHAERSQRHRQRAGLLGERRHLCAGREVLGGRVRERQLHDVRVAGCATEVRREHRLDDLVHAGGEQVGEPLERERELGDRVGVGRHLVTCLTRQHADLIELSAEFRCELLELGLTIYMVVEFLEAAIEVADERSREAPQRSLRS